MHSLTTTTSLPIFTGWPQSSMARLDYNGVYTVNLPLCQVAITASVYRPCTGGQDNPATATSATLISCSIELPII